MSIELSEKDEMVEMERRFVEEAFNRGLLDVVDETHSSATMIHWSPDYNDVAGLKAWIRSVRRAFPDFHMAIDFTVVEEDTITVGFTATGTHTRRFMGIPATNRLVHITGMWTHRVEDGEIVEGWVSFNGHDMLQQLGLTFPRALVTIPSIYAKRAAKWARKQIQNR